MEYSLTFYAITAFSIFLTGLSKGGFGGGLGVMSVPMMSLIVSPQLATGLLMPILITMDIITVWQYRWKWSLATVKHMIPGALMGLAIGMLVFQWINAATIKLLIGVMALFLVLRYVMAHMRVRQAKHVKPYLVFLLGLSSGFASFIGHAGGPPVKGYLLSRGFDKTTFVATNTLFFFSLNGIKTVIYIGMGQLTLQTFNTSLLFTPMLLIGLYAGFKLHTRFDQNVFTKIVYFFLAVAAIKLLIDGFSDLSLEPWL